MKGGQVLSLSAKLGLLCALITAIVGLALIAVWSDRGADLISATGGRAMAIAVLVSGAAVLAGLATYLFFNLFIGRPIRVLRRAASHVATGDAAFRAQITSPKEFAQLGQSFNEMIDSVVHAQSKADIDKLTGLFNYRHARNYLGTQVRLAARYGRHLTIALIDIDHFQEINDLYGHEAGDMVLAKAADYVKSRLRQVDYVARYSGEEFLVVLPETAAAPAMMVIERIHAGFADHVFIERGESKNPVFMSAGVADFPRSGEDEANLTAAADMALLLAKRRGRNQVAYFRALDEKAG